MPKPKGGEKEEDFIGRCVSEIIHEGKLTQEQALGKCYGIWRQGGKSKTEKSQLFKVFVDVTKAIAKDILKR